MTKTSGREMLSEAALNLLRVRFALASLRLTMRARKTKAIKLCSDVGRVAQILVCEVACSLRQARLDLPRLVSVFVSRALKLRMSTCIKGNGFAKWTECAHYVSRVQTGLGSAYAARRSHISIFI